MNDAETASAVADAVIVVIERGAAVTDRFVVATAEMGQRVQEFLDADRAMMSARGGDAEQMAAGRRLSAARRALEASVAILRTRTDRRLPSPDLSVARHRGRISRAWRWLWHGDPW